MGTLYLVSTPIGNLEDLSARARRVLAEAGTVLAEDTRRTRALLAHLGTPRPLLSLHEHNERDRVERVLARLEAGETFALVSDAGTPLLSDPGERLVRAAIDAGHDVIPIPGPSAILHALVGSGLPAHPFLFLGFAPRKGTERREFLDRVAESRASVVLFESPQRVGPLLASLAEGCGADRPAVVARELTKVHEEFVRGTLGELAERFAGEPPRGEVTVVVGPSAAPDDPPVELDAARREAEKLMARGMAPSRVARELARTLGIPRNIAYDLAVEARGAPPSPDRE